jgi:hypothetical protein
MNDNFKPDLPPQETLEMGVSGGWYFEGDLSEYPANWLTKARLSEDGFDVSLNYFGVASGKAWKNDSARDGSRPMIPVDGLVVLPLHPGPPHS